MVLLSKIVLKSNKDQRDYILSTLVSILISEKDESRLCLVLKCLCTIADEVELSLLIELMNHCYHKILEIVNIADKKQFHSFLRYSSKLMRITIEKLSNARITCDIEENDSGYIFALLSSWTLNIATWMSSSLTLDEIIIHTPSLIEMTKTLSMTMETFPDECADSIPTALKSSWIILCTVRDTYMKQIYNNFNNCDDYKGYASDGDRIDLEILVVQILELLCIGFTSSELSLQNLAFDDLNSLLEVIISYMQLTSEGVDHWVDDANDFVALEEDEFTIDFSLRNRGAGLIKEICKNGKDSAIKCFFLVAQSQWQILCDFTTVINKDDLNIQFLKIEGLLWSLSSVGKVYMKYCKIISKYDLISNDELTTKIKQKLIIAKSVIASIPYSIVAQSIGSIINFLLQPEINTIPIVMGRVVSLFSIYVELFDFDTIKVISSQCVELMKVHNNLNQLQPLSTRLQACRALSGIINKSYHQLKHQTSDVSSDFYYFISTISPSILESSLSLISVVTESTIHYPSELISVIVKRFGNIITLTLANQVVDIGTSIINKYSSDPLALDIVSDMLSYLIKISNGIGAYSCHEYLLPYLTKLLLNQNQQQVSSIVCSSSTSPILIETVIDLLSNIGISNQRIECNEQYIPSTQSYRLSVLQILIAALHNTNERDKIQREIFQSINCVLSYNENGQILLSEIFSRETAYEFYIAIIPKVMSVLSSCNIDDDAIESECIGPISGVINHLLINFNEVMDSSTVEMMITNVLEVCQNTQSQYIRYSLGFAIIHIFSRYAGAISNIISNIIHTDQTKPNTMVFMFDLWFKLHTSNLSKYCTIISTIGLIELLKVLSMNIENNHAIVVKILQIILPTLPKLLLNTNNEEEEVEEEDDDEFNDDDDDDDGDDDYGDEDEEWSSDVDEDANEKKSPFAPAEMYFLSDMMNNKGKNNDDVIDEERNEDIMFINISDNLVFCPHKYDPLSKADIQTLIVEYLTSQIAYGSNELPLWMNHLSPDDQGLIHALIGK
jgi:hypothetical protein